MKVEDFNINNYKIFLGNQEITESVSIEHSYNGAFIIWYNDKNVSSKVEFVKKDS